MIRPTVTEIANLEKADKSIVCQIVLGTNSENLIQLLNRQLLLVDFSLVLPLKLYGLHSTCIPFKENNESLEKNIITTEY